jgi:hypothetical protein
MAAFNPATNMDFSMGSTEQKMSMSLGKHFRLQFVSKGSLLREVVLSDFLLGC